MGILKTTLLTKPTVETQLSTYQSCTSSNNTVFHAAFTLELLESDLRSEVTETSDTPQSSEMSRMKMLRPVDLLFQPPWAEDDHALSVKKCYTGVLLADKNAVLGT